MTENKWFTCIYNPPFLNHWTGPLLLLLCLGFPCPQSRTFWVRKAWNARFHAIFLASVLDRLLFNRRIARRNKKVRSFFKSCHSHLIINCKHSWRSKRAVTLTFNIFRILKFVLRKEGFGKRERAKRVRWKKISSGYWCLELSKKTATLGTDLSLLELVCLSEASVLFPPASPLSLNQWVQFAYLQDALAP